MRLFHIVAASVWDRSRRDGEYRPESLDSEGFVHFSFVHQVSAVANARYRTASGLCVVEVDSAALPHEIRVEDSYGSGTEFPHVYGAIPTAAAIRVHPLERDAAGDWTFSPADPDVCASTDH
jgi:uncharacterized protein (DUF952 family)